LKILYLTRPYKHYATSNYQKEFINSFIHSDFKVQIFEYPFGYGEEISKFDPIEYWKEIHKLSKSCDCVLLGHHWLGDHPFKNIIPIGGEEVGEIKIPVYAFLNKEYVRIQDKLNYFKKVGVRKIFSHCSIAGQLTQDNFFHNMIHFIPFAIMPNFSQITRKKIDLFFSGIVRNPFHYCKDQALRIEVENELFSKFLRVRLFPKKHKYKIFWNGIDVKNNRLINKLNGYRRLGHQEYSQLMSYSKSVFCTISMNLITPRFYESVSSGCHIIAPRNEMYKDSEHLQDAIIELDEPSNIREKIESAQKPIDKDLADFFRNEHTYDKRVERIFQLIK